MNNDPVNHPAHYTAHPSGIQCVTVAEHFNFCLGNAIKYIWRADEKGSAVQDLEKAKWYLDREIRRRQENAEELKPATAEQMHAAFRQQIAEENPEELKPHPAGKNFYHDREPTPQQIAEETAEELKPHPAGKNFYHGLDNSRHPSDSSAAAPRNTAQWFCLKCGTSEPQPLDAGPLDACPTCGSKD